MKIMNRVNKSITGIIVLTMALTQVIPTGWSEMPANMEQEMTPAQAVPVAAIGNVPVHEPLPTLVSPGEAFLTSDSALTQVEEAVSNEPQINRTYDKRGRLRSEEISYYDASGNLISKELTRWNYNGKRLNEKEKITTTYNEEGVEITNRKETERYNKDGSLHSIKMEEWIRNYQGILVSSRQQKAIYGRNVDISYPKNVKDLTVKIKIYGEDGKTVNEKMDINFEYSGMYFQTCCGEGDTSVDHGSLWPRVHATGSYTNEEGTFQIDKVFRRNDNRYDVGSEWELPTEELSELIRSLTKGGFIIIDDQFKHHYGRPILLEAGQ